LASVKAAVPRRATFQTSDQIVVQIPHMRVSGHRTPCEIIVPEARGDSQGARPDRQRDAFRIIWIVVDRPQRDPSTAAAGFKQAIANLGNVGFAFGGGCWRLFFWTWRSCERWEREVCRDQICSRMTIAAPTKVERHQLEILAASCVSR
jgi:hypothetical protein